MNKINANNIREYLISISDKDYKTHVNSIGVSNNVLGIRIPVLREIAKEIAKDDWRTFVRDVGDLYFEERMIHGMVLGYIKIEVDELIKYLDLFIPKINNWSICDSSVSTLKVIKKHNDIFWEYIQKYIKSDQEFDIRFGVVVLLMYFINDRYIDKVINILDIINNDGYYVKMAVAWALSYCYIKYPTKTMEYYNNSNVDNFTYNKAIQKTIESFQVKDEDKIVLKTMKRK